MEKQKGMVYVSKRMMFSSAHRMWNPELSQEENKALYGKCSNPGGHGHNYIVEITLRGTSDERTGILVNLDDVGRILKQEVAGQFDHCDLNTSEAMKGRVPSLENIVVAIWELLDGKITGTELYEVRVWETENNCAWYRGGRKCKQKN